MDRTRKNPAARPKHLMTDVQLASRVGATADDLAQGHRHGNGIRVHRTYILVVSVVALILLVVAIAVASATM